ncbi:MAG: hypothetical protein AB8G96_16290 [Phycisphaerales bacterium]
MVRAQEHLKILGILQMVFGGLMSLGGLAMSLYVFFGLIALSASDPEAKAVGIIFIMFGLIGFVIFVGLGLLFFLTGRSLHDRRHHQRCIIVAAVQCVFMPLGTILGIFTIITLTKPEVKSMFTAG